MNSGMKGFIGYAGTCMELRGVVLWVWGLEVQALGFRF